MGIWARPMVCKATETAKVDGFCHARSVGGLAYARALDRPSFSCLDRARLLRSVSIPSYCAILHQLVITGSLPRLRYVR